jgi:hypothetical protein
MTRDLAGRVYDILVREAGAAEYWREDFIRSHEAGCEEYRLMSRLGFGGKFWVKRFGVSCYSEDLTPEREAVITRTNAALAALRGEQG